MRVISERSRRAGARRGRAIAVLAAGALVLAACGGDDDGGATTTIPSSTTQPPITDPPVQETVEPTAAEPTAEPEVEPVRDGATVIVANASRVNGAAGRMSERLAAVGYTTGEATNGTAGQLEATVVYYDPANTAAQAVAESVRSDLGGDPVTV